MRRRCSLHEVHSATIQAKIATKSRQDSELEFILIAATVLGFVVPTRRHPLLDERDQIGATSAGGEQRLRPEVDEAHANENELIMYVDHGKWRHVGFWKLNG
jgi:hypothetical protein